MALAFASDFDKTLWFHEEPGHLRAADLEAIERFRAGGNLFGVASGRSLKGIDLELGDRFAFDFHILSTGALVLGPDRTVISRSCVDPQLMRELNDIYATQDAQIIFHGNDTVYSFGKPLPMQTHIDDLAEIGPYLYGMSMYVGSFERAIEAAAEVNERFGYALTAYPNRAIVDIVPAGCSKGHAVALAKEALGASAIAAIGDSFNDVPMFEAADASFTFHASPEDVQARAGHVVDSVAEAIGIFVREFGQAR